MPGQTVFVHARSEEPGVRPSNYGTALAFATSGIAPPTGLSSTADVTDGSKALLAWTVGAGSAFTDVFVRLQSDPISADVRVATVLPGSTGYPLAGLTPGTSYTASVQHRAANGELSSKATITFTAGSTTIALKVPTGVHAVVGSTDAAGIAVVDGTYGIDVTATEIPGRIEFWEAVETGVGTGVYGAATVVSVAASVAGAVTSYRNIAPHDGLRRQLTARHVRTGAAPSDFTYPVSMDPWGAAILANIVAELTNVHWSEDDIVATIMFTRSAPVAEVWAAYAYVPASSGNYDYATLVAPYVGPIAAGWNSYVVPRPKDGFVTLVQLEPRLADLSSGPVRRLVITASVQVPHVELDDLETATTGTQWWKITERGIPVSSVQVQTQVGTNPISAFGPPTRSPGGTSVVRHDVLGDGEYEHDVLLDPTRQSWIMPRLILSNGDPPIVLGPFGFDRDKLPNLASVAVAGSVVTILGDTDTKSVGLYAKSPGTWKYEIDGLSAAIDVTAVGTNGVAGLASGTSGVFTAKVLSDLVAYIGMGTFSDARDVTVLNGGTPSAASWSTVQVAAPPYNGSDEVTITLKTSAAPSGWTVKVYLLESSPASASPPTTDATAMLSPTLSAPPAAATAYTYIATNQRSVADSHSSTVSLRIRADLLDNTGAVKDTKTATAFWYTGGGFV
jgi:hypothetical protein